MANRYTTVPEKNLSSGIDAKSAENDINPSYVEDAVNTDVGARGILSKRKGYQKFSGSLPVRPIAIEQDDSDSEITFTLPSGINLVDVRSSPLVVYGKINASDLSGGTTSPFSSNTSQYFSSFTTNALKELSSGSGTLSLETEHGFSTQQIAVGIVEYDLATGDTEEFIPDSIEIDATYNVEIDYTVPSDKQSYVFYSDKTDSGSTTILIDSGDVAALGGPISAGTTVTIPAATHSLSSNDMQIWCYEVSGTDYIRIYPDTTTIKANGDVELVFNTATTGSVVVILSVASNTIEGTVGAGQTKTIRISNPTSQFAFVSCYLENASSDREFVWPNFIKYDSSLDELQVEFVNNTTSSAQFYLVYEYATISANKITVPYTASMSDGSSSNVQLSIWGLIHDEIYDDFTASQRKGWVHHLDSYLTNEERRPVAGLGGHFFESKTYSESGTTYKYNQLYPSLRARLSADTVLGPVFWDTNDRDGSGDGPSRTRGYLTSTTGQSNFLEVTNLEYDSAESAVKVTIHAPSWEVWTEDNITPAAGLSSVIEVDVDYLTIQQAGFSEHNGQFLIKKVLSAGSDNFYVWVENDSISDDCYDEVDVGGLAGIFTDKITTTSANKFAVGDYLNAVVIGDDFSLQVLKIISTTQLVVNGLTDQLSLGIRQRLVGTRTSSIVPLRDSDEVVSVTNIVRGDNISYSLYDRFLNVKHVNAVADRTVTVNGTTVTITSAHNTDSLHPGQKIFLYGTSVSGDYEIESITSSTVFELTESASSTSVTSQYLLGTCVSIDESLEWGDSELNTYTFTVHTRWIPIEIPEDSFDLTTQYKSQIFDKLSYINQNLTRSTGIQNSLLLTDGENQVHKFDGDNIYRAGLPRWQPGLFVTKDTGASGVIDVPAQITVAGSAATNVFTATTASDAGLLSVGDNIYSNIDSTIYTVIGVNTTAGTVQVSDDFTTAGSVTAIYKSEFKRSYYFRLNAIDANDNIVASAATQLGDYVVELDTDAAIELKLVGMPPFDIYDYDRIELEIYGTKGTGVAPYYKLTTLPISFDNNDGYILYTDSASDESLFDLDVVNSALLGAEAVGNLWDQPPLCKHITSIQGRAVYANIKEPQNMDIRMLQDGTTAIALADLENTKFAFKRDGTGTTTDNVDVQIFELIHTGNVALTNDGTASSEVSFGSNTFTVTPGAGHTFSAGDWVYLFHSDSTSATNLRLAGWWQIASVSTTVSFTVAWASDDNPGTGYATAADIDSYVSATLPADVPVWTGTDYNYQTQSERLSLSAPYVAFKRLALAINACQRMVNTSISGQSAYTPWLSAGAGNDFSSDQLFVYQNKIESDTFSLTVTKGGSSIFNLFINNTNTLTASARSRRFDSRLTFSYPNFAEIVDASFVQTSADSDTAVDVNPADGQEITGVIPFFGESAFGAAQTDGPLVVFKTQSIYLVDPNTGEIKKLETQGLGCTYPKSIAPTNRGIMFANYSGMYRLGRDLKVHYIGMFMERKWRNIIGTDTNSLDVAYGHHFSSGSAYRLSVPIDADNVNYNTEVYVYDHTKEDDFLGGPGAGIGAWSRYDSINSVGWCNLDGDEYYAGVDGFVRIRRNAGDLTDYRDDDQAIEMVVTLRMMDFGNAGLRKVLGGLHSHFRAIGRSEGTTITVATDGGSYFLSTDAIIIDVDETVDGLGDTQQPKIISIRSSIKPRRFQYLQAKYTNSTIDEDIELAGVDYVIGGLTESGTQEARDTSE